MYNNWGGGNCASRLTFGQTNKFNLINYRLDTFLVKGTRDVPMDEGNKDEINLISQTATNKMPSKLKKK